MSFVYTWRRVHVWRLEDNFQESGSSALSIQVSRLDTSSLPLNHLTNPNFLYYVQWTLVKAFSYHGFEILASTLEVIYFLKLPVTSNQGQNEKQADRKHASLHPLTPFFNEVLLSLAHADLNVTVILLPECWNSGMTDHIPSLISLISKWKDEGGERTQQQYLI